MRFNCFLFPHHCLLSRAPAFLQKSPFIASLFHFSSIGCSLALLLLSLAHGHHVFEPPFDFIMSVYPRPISCFGKDTPISLGASTRQLSFRKIMHLRLKRLLIYSDPPILLVVKLILGSAHLSRDEYPRDNTNISSKFVASLLDQKLSKQLTWNLTRELFPVEILQDLQEILNKAIHDSSAPRPSDRILFNAHGALINYYPFLLDLKDKELNRHRKFTSAGLSYLKWHFLGEDPEAEGKEEILFLFSRMNGFCLYLLQKHILNWNRVAEEARAKVAGAGAMVGPL